MCRQVADLRQELERKIRDESREAENTAVRRAEESLQPQVQTLDERLQAHLQAIQSRLEEAFPKISALADHHECTRAELQPLHARADAAAARLDRLAVQTATTTKDHHDLHQDYKDVICEIRTKIAAESKQREELGVEWSGNLDAVAVQAQAATAAAMARADEQVKHVLEQTASSERRLQARLEEQAERSNKEQKLGNEDVVNRLRPEIQAVSNAMSKKVEESTEQAEALVRKTTTLLRGETEACEKRVTAAGERCVENKARELSSCMTEGFEQASKHSEGVRVSADSALHDATVALRKCITDTRSGLSSEADLLKSQISAVEYRQTQATEESELRAVDAARKQLEDTAATIRRELDEAQQALLEGDQTLRKDVLQQLEDASLKLEKNTADMGGSCNNSSDAAVGKAVALLRSELAEVLRSCSERTDAARCAAADELHAEVNSRKQTFAVSDATREALAANLREELQNVAVEAAKLATTLSANLDRRVDASNEGIACLERAHEAANKEHADNWASIRNQLRVERQRTEEADHETQKLTVSVRDTLEARIQSEVHDLRGAVGECRTKIYDEANGLRTELRQQPSKREVAEVAATATQQYTELVAALDGHRSRLEAAVADFCGRCREARNESNEARLRTQRETMALGHELAQLRAATTSLTNGTLKALQVIGFVRDEVDVASSADARRTMAAQAAGEVPPTPRRKPDGDHMKAIEVEDLLEWEKVGKSLATRIARQWQPKESSGVPTVLSALDAKAESQELIVLQTLLREASPGAFATLSASEATMMGPGMAFSGKSNPLPPISPKPPIGTAPHSARSNLRLS